MERNTQKALSVYGIIRQQIQGSNVVGSDETGCAISGKKGWVYTWQNNTLTVIAALLNRGIELSKPILRMALKKLFV
jgi:hypothetical protein